jgi:hypothetical protein
MDFDDENLSVIINQSEAPILRKLIQELYKFLDKGLTNDKHLFLMHGFDLCDCLEYHNLSKTTFLVEENVHWFLTDYGFYYQIFFKNKENLSLIKLMF